MLAIVPFAKHHPALSGNPGTEPLANSPARVHSYAHGWTWPHMPEVTGASPVFVHRAFVSLRTLRRPSSSRCSSMMTQQGLSAHSGTEIGVSAFSANQRKPANPDDLLIGQGVG